MRMKTERRRLPQGLNLRPCATGKGLVLASFFQLFQCPGIVAEGRMAQEL